MSSLNLSESDKIRHVYRRLGLGVSKSELAEGEKLGLTKTIDRLLDYESVNEEFNVSPWSFFVDEREGMLQPNPDASRVAQWWTLRMLVTKRPLQEKLTLFWHDHFAVSAAKVNNGPTMLEYNETLRREANGNFRKLLGDVSRDPAMIRWLDTDTSVKARPNENFARELMELFTLGVGHYSERDIKEAAKAFTGWGIRPAPVERGTSALGQMRLAITEERPMILFMDTPALRDQGVKTILGKSARFTPDDVMDLLVSRPQHARFLTAKLWDWFAYPNPEPEVIERMAKVYTDSKYEIKPVLQAIVTSKEFWSERCYRRKVKNPVDFLVAFFRQAEMEQIVAKELAEKPIDPLTPTNRTLRDYSAGTLALLSRQGMRLLYPPDVDGWIANEQWLSTATVVERLRSGEYLIRRRGPIAKHIVDKVLAKKPTSSEELVTGLIDAFDVPIDAERKKVIVDKVESAGGVKPLARADVNAANHVTNVLRLMMAVPEYQFC